MKKNIKIISLIFIITLSISFNVLADWRAPVTITKENQKEYNIEIYVSEDTKDSNRYIVEINKFSNKCCWIYVNKKIEFGFGKNATQKIKFDESGKSFYLLNKKYIDNSYLLMDHCHTLKDGGYYYIVDLSTYAVNKNL